MKEQKQFFSVTSIPQILRRRPQIRSRIMTVEQIETIMEHNEQAIIPVFGDCLEGVRVMNGGWVAVDFTHFPAPPRYRSKGGDGSSDLCACGVIPPDRRIPVVMLKEYLGVWGRWQMVGTRYDLSNGPHPYNVAWEAKKIFGVVFASWDADGYLLWKREPDSFPEELKTTPTIQVGNAGAPAPAETAMIQSGGFCPYSNRRKGECNRCLEG